METLLKKQPQRPALRLLSQTENQNGPVDPMPKLSPRQAASVITAADHQLRQLKKRQQNLQSAPTTLGAGNEKAKLLSNRSGGPQNPL